MLTNLIALLSLLPGPMPSTGLRCIATLWPHGICAFRIDPSGNVSEYRDLDDKRSSPSLSDEADLQAGMKGPGLILDKAAYWMDDSGRIRASGDRRGKFLGWDGKAAYFQSSERLWRQDRSGDEVSWKLPANVSINRVFSMDAGRLLYLSGQDSCQLWIGAPGKMESKLRTVPMRFTEAIETPEHLFLAFRDDEHWVGYLYAVDRRSGAVKQVMSRKAWGGMSRDPENSESIVLSYNPAFERRVPTVFERVDANGRSKVLCRLNRDLGGLMPLGPHRLLVGENNHCLFLRVLDLRTKKLQVISEIPMLDLACWPIAAKRM